MVLLGKTGRTMPQDNRNEMSENEAAEIVLTMLITDIL